jgi:hypothetical protein
VVAAPELMQSKLALEKAVATSGLQHGLILLVKARLPKRQEKIIDVRPDAPARRTRFYALAARRSIADYPALGSVVASMTEPPENLKPSASSAFFQLTSCMHRSQRFHAETFRQAKHSFLSRKQDWRKK